MERQVRWAFALNPGCSHGFGELLESSEPSCTASLKDGRFSPSYKLGKFQEWGVSPMATLALAELEIVLSGRNEM